jgi:hypothetical protein
MHCKNLTDHCLMSRSVYLKRVYTVIAMTVTSAGEGVDIGMILLSTLTHNHPKEAIRNRHLYRRQ